MTPLVRCCFQRTPEQSAKKPAPNWWDTGTPELRSTRWGRWHHAGLLSQYGAAEPRNGRAANTASTTSPASAMAAGSGSPTTSTTSGRTGNESMRGKYIRVGCLSMEAHGRPITSATSARCSMLDASGCLASATSTGWMVPSPSWATARPTSSASSTPGGSASPASSTLTAASTAAAMGDGECPGL